MDLDFGPGHIIARGMYVYYGGGFAARMEAK